MKTFQHFLITKFGKENHIAIYIGLMASQNKLTQFFLRVLMMDFYSY